MTGINSHAEVAAAMRRMRAARKMGVEYHPAYSADQMRAAVDDMQFQLNFYKRRCEQLQEWQHRMRDPERTIVCDILANGKTLNPPGNRYDAPASVASASDGGLPQPWDYCYVWNYEWSAGQHRSFSASRRNGRHPDATVALYTADQMRSAVDAEREARAHELSAALGWPGGISTPVTDFVQLLRLVATMRIASTGQRGEITHQDEYLDGEAQTRQLGADVLHCYAQACWHDESYLSGGSAALRCLRMAIDRALLAGAGECDLYTSDGEGYTMHVVAMTDAAAERQVVPYTDDYARQPWANSFGPWTVLSVSGRTMDQR